MSVDHDGDVVDDAGGKPQALEDGSGDIGSSGGVAKEADAAIGID
jgi:hypothetical protein